MKDHWKLIVSLIMLIIIVVFALQNTETVMVSLFFFSVSVPIVLVMLLCLLFGVIIGLIATMPTMKIKQRKYDQAVKELQQQIQAKETELQDKDHTLVELRKQLVAVDTITAQDQQKEQEKLNMQTAPNPFNIASRTTPIDKN